MATFLDLLYDEAPLAAFDGYQLASIFAGALAPIIAIDLLGPASEGTANVDKVAIYMTVASVLTVIAVVFAKETRATSLRHDRVLDR